MDELEKMVAALFRNGATEDQVRQYVHQHRFANPEVAAPTNDPLDASHGIQAGAAPRQEDSGDRWLGRLRAVSDGASLGFGANIAGAGAAIKGAFTGKDPRAEYRRVRDVERAGLKDFAEGTAGSASEGGHPFEAGLGELIGGAVPAIAAGGGRLLTSGARAAATALPRQAASAAARRLAKAVTLGKLVGTGAAYGAASEVGHTDDGSLGDYIHAAGHGAKVGGIAAPIGAGIVKGAVGFGKMAGLGNLLSGGRDAILKMAERSGIDVGDLGSQFAGGGEASAYAPAAAAFREKARPLVQAGVSHRPQLEEKALSVLQRMHGGRQAAGDRLNEIVLPGGKPRIVTDPHIDQTLANAEPLFQDAINAAKGQVEAVGRPLVGRKLTFNGTIDDARAQGIPIPAQYKMIPPSGHGFTNKKVLNWTYDGPEEQSLESLDNLKRGLAKVTADKFGRGGTSAIGAKTLADRHDEVYNRLRDIIPGYGEAKDAYRSFKEAIPETEGAFGARYNKRVKRYQMGGNADAGLADDATFQGERAVSSFGTGSPKTGIMHGMIAKFRSGHKLTRGRVAADATDLLLKTGPDAQALLNDLPIYRNAVGLRGTARAKALAALIGNRAGRKATEQ